MILDMQMEFKIKRAILTGGTGVIGSALIQELARKNIEVVVACRPRTPRLHHILKDPHVQIVECGLEDIKNLPMLIKEQFDVFFHLGWDGTFGTARNDMYLQNQNVKYTLDAVQTASVLGCKVFVGIGSQAEYGRTEGMLQPDTPTFPENGYGTAKLCAGQMSRILCREHGIRHVWARVLSVYGSCDGENTMVMSAIKNFLNGNHASFTKGEQQWDYLYSKDAAKMLLALAEKGTDGKIYCLGSGTVRTVAEYIDVIYKICGSCGTIGFGDIPYAERQVMHLCADISTIKKDTDVVPQYTFEEGIAETVAWYKSQMNGSF